MYRYDPIEHCKWCNVGYDTIKQSIHCPHEAKPKPISEREKIAVEVERMYGPHDRRFKTAIEIANAIRRRGTQP